MRRRRWTWGHTMGVLFSLDVACFALPHEHPLGCDALKPFLLVLGLLGLFVIITDYTWGTPV